MTFDDESPIFSWIIGVSSCVIVIDNIYSNDDSGRRNGTFLIYILRRGGGETELS